MKKKSTVSQDNLKGNISKSSLGILNTLKEDIMTSIMSEKDENNISLKDQENKYLNEQKCNIAKEEKSKKVKDQNSTNEKEENCRSTNVSKNNTAKEYESKGVKDPLCKNENTPNNVQNKVHVEGINNFESQEENNEKVKVKSCKKRKRSKRSFMLDDMVIQRLNLLKLCMSNKDLSTIVEDAVNQYFDSNKDSIDKIFDLYDKVK